MKSNEESRIQCELIKHVDQLFALRWPDYMVNGHSPLYACPNGGKRNIVTATILKREGVRRGVLDLFLPIRRGDACGLFIEMKTPEKTVKPRKPAGKLSPEQKGWIAFLERDYDVVVCKSAQGALDVIIEYMERTVY